MLTQGQQGTESANAHSKTQCNMPGAPAHSTIHVSGYKVPILALASITQLTESYHMACMPLVQPGRLHQYTVQYRYGGQCKTSRGTRPLVTRFHVMQHNRGEPQFRKFSCPCSAACV